jgi:hypothetical protein
VGVGVQKAGTSWWYSLVTEHPDVYHHESFHKERHFFDRFATEPFSEADAADYERWFPRPAGRLTGEWTPDYLHLHWTASMLRVAAPEAKILVVLRDPVERFRSGLDHYRQRGERLTSIVVNDAFNRGLYGAQLSRLQAAVPPDQILVLQYEACVEDPRGHLAETFRFLGIDDSFANDVGGIRREVSPTRGSVPLSEFTRHDLIELYQDDLRLLARCYPELDLDRWSSFSRSTAQHPGP